MKPWSPPDLPALSTPVETLQRLVNVRGWSIALLALGLALIPRLLPVSLPLFLLLMLLGGYFCFNLALGLRARHRAESGLAIGAVEVAAQLTADLLVMALVLFCTGGATNPLIFALMLPVAVSAFLLPLWGSATLALLATACYALLMVDHLPLLTNPVHAARLHLMGMGATFAFSIAALVLLISHMTAMIRARDARLNQFRERQLRDEKLVALGTLAAGTAHELGTPLATMGILTSELRQDGSLSQTVREDLELLWQEVLHCKRIISGITAGAGAQRLEGAHPEPVGPWITRLLVQWQESHPGTKAALQGTLNDSPLLVVEPTLEQGLINLLDNAANTGSPVRLRVDWDPAWIYLDISDQGPGFSAEVMDQAGKTRLSPGGSGSGIGLLLSFATIERLGGQLTLTNPAGGGGLARVRLPQAKPHNSHAHSAGNPGHRR